MAVPLVNPPAELDENFNLLDAVARQIGQLPRRLLELLVQHAIDRLDEEDSDPDIEANGDETDGTFAEDEWLVPPTIFGFYHGAGCSISDPGC